MNALVSTACGFGKWCGLNVEVDVVSDEEIEIAVTVVVEEGAAGVPAGFRLEEASFGSDVGEGTVAVVAVEDVLTVVTDEEIVPTVVVVVADTAALSPSAACKTGFSSNVGESTIPIVLEEMRDGFLVLGKAFETGTVDEKDIDPVIVVIVEESYSAACGFEQVSVLVLTPIDSFGIEAGLAGDVDEADAKRSASDRRGSTFGRWPRLGVVGGA